MIEFLKLVSLTCKKEIRGRKREERRGQGVQERRGGPAEFSFVFRAVYAQKVARAGVIKTYPPLRGPFFKSAREKPETVHFRYVYVHFFRFKYVRFSVTLCYTGCQTIMGTSIYSK